MTDSQHIVNIKQTGYLAEENTISRYCKSNKVLLRRELGNKVYVCNTQNHIKMATNNGRDFEFYVAFTVHIIQMGSTILKNKQSTNCLRRLCIKD